MIAELGRYLIALALLASFVQMLTAWRGADQGGRGAFARSRAGCVRNRGAGGRRRDGSADRQLRAV
jgi:cytochrome c biogenesis factor